jgi:transposase
MAMIQVKCRHCTSEKVIKNGTTEKGTQRFRCQICKRAFLLDYTYNACKPNVKESIIEMTMHASGIRDTASVLGISPTTVMNTLKKRA